MTLDEYIKMYIDEYGSRYDNFNEATKQLFIRNCTEEYKKKFKV
jgi:predicted solute-binding protein